MIRPRPAGPSRAGAPRGRLLVRVVYVTEVFMVGTETTVVNLASPAIARESAVPPAAGGAVDGGYLVSVAVCIPLSGRLTDRFGAKRVLLTALAGFGVGPNIKVLVPPAGTPSARSASTSATTAAGAV